MVAWIQPWNNPASVPDFSLQTLGRPQREDSVVVGVCVCVCVCVWVRACAQSLSYVSLFCDSMDCLQGSSVHGILQARILERVAVSSSRGSSRPRALIPIPCTGKQILCHCTSGGARCWGNNWDPGIDAGHSRVYTP